MKMKSLVDKTVANQKMIETRRKHVSFGVGDSQKIQVWEAQVGNDGTPLLACYNSWKKVSQLQQAKKVSQQEKLDDYSHIPQMKNKKKTPLNTEQEEEVGGFLSGSDDDFDDVENFKLKEERGKKRKSDDISDEEEVGDDESEGEEDAPDSTVQESSEGENEDEVEGDAVEDLRLEDLDSESDAEIADEFDDDEDETNANDS